MIAKRAQVSDGALFRHFPTMGDFMAATAREVMQRQLGLFTKRVAEIPADKPALQSALTILRDVTGNPTNTVMYELLIAARTDEKLKATLQEVLTEYASNIYDIARSLPGAEQFPQKPSRPWWRYSPTRSTAPPWSARCCRSPRSKRTASSC